jgi:hypothetical protein
MRSAQAACGEASMCLEEKHKKTSRLGVVEEVACDVHILSVLCPHRASQVQYSVLEAYTGAGATTTLPTPQPSPTL